MQVSKVIEDIISKTKAMGNTMAGSKLQSLQLAEALNGYSVEAIKASISESTLNEMQIKAILSQKGLTGNILETTTAELTAVTATNAMTVSEGAATTATVGLGTAIKGLGVSLKNLAVAHPILTAIVAISAAIGVGITLYEKYGNTLENLQKKAKEAKDIYDNTASEINNINNELKTTQDRIKELEGKDSLSFVEQDELEKLKASNDELERELRIKKTIAQQE